MTLEEEIQLGTVALEAVAKIVTTVLDAKAGKLDPAVALTALAQLHDNLAANNATIDKLADEKFDHGGPLP